MTVYSFIIFTSHYVTINSFSKTSNALVIIVFTSHYVTINSMTDTKISLLLEDLHPTM